MGIIKTGIFFVFTTFILCIGVKAQIMLPSLVSDSMILQRNIPLKIWGWAAAGEKVTIGFNKKKYNTVTGEDGRWAVILPAMKEGGPYEMLIKGSNEIAIKDIWVGDVWLCSGQSNMEFAMNKVRFKYADDIAASASYLIREFSVKERYSYKPEEKAEGSWKPANPTNILKFTAVGYFFAKKLYETYKVPIGILHSSWPGTPAESWISIDSLKNFPDYVKTAKQFANAAYTDSVLKGERTLTQNWYRQVNTSDKGYRQNGASWAGKPIDTSWLPINMPGYWENQGAGNIDGAVWLKHVVTVPKSFMNTDVYLELGLIDDIDSTYINGQQVGFTDNKYNQRRYKVPAGLLKEGENILTVRVIDNEGQGGIVPGKVYRLTNGTEDISLAGNWFYKVGYATTGLSAQNFIRIAYKPTYVYNGMIEPILNYSIKGAIWYQGEGNTSKFKAFEYRQLLPVMIHEWRAKWQQGNFPFLIVQLANFMPAKPQPDESNWAMLRESQTIVASKEPNCGLAVAIDIGEANDIHPLNKKDVGYRLALVADKVAYNNTKTISSGPGYLSMEKQGNKIVLSFDNIGGGLVAKNGDTLKQFAIAGEDRVFVWANAKIEGNKVIVWSDKVLAPVAVRYAWADNPEGCNLYNKEGLPASPFRTDNWIK